MIKKGVHATSTGLVSNFYTPATFWVEESDPSREVVVMGR